MQTILIPFSKNAPKDKMKASIPLIANKSTSKLQFIHVITLPSAVGLIDLMATKTDHVEEELRADEENAFNEFMEELKKDGYQVEVSKPVGFFDQEFIELANTLMPDYIIMFTQGSHSVVEDIFGTHTSAIFEKIKSPIFVMPYDSNVTSFSKAAVGLNMENEDFNVLNTYFKFETDFNLTSSFIKIDNNFQLDIINDEQVLEKLHKMYPGKIEYIVHRQAEDVAEGLEKYSNEANADLIVLFTTKRNIIEKLFHKSVTKDLVLHSKKPLLIYHY
jgi:nucleotide-binding universal stress UspA family protein